MFKGKYDTLTSHKTMIQDKYRTCSYIDAINLTVDDGHTVIDFGSGSGLLSIAAARAGASKVYAIERNTKTAEWLKNNIQKNNLEDVIEVFIGDAIEFITSHEDLIVDTIISECIGDHLFENKMIFEYLKLADYFNAQYKIPQSFALCAYPSLVVEKHKDINSALQMLEKRDIRIDMSNSNLDDEILDVGYFNGLDDGKDPYFCLQEKHNIEESIQLFQFKDINDLERYMEKPGIIRKAVRFPEGYGYILLYFESYLHDDILFTNHPNRDYHIKHSYFQRLVKKQGDSGTLYIDTCFDDRNNEDAPCKNLYIEYDK